MKTKQAIRDELRCRIDEVSGKARNVKKQDKREGKEKCETRSDEENEIEDWSESSQRGVTDQ